MVTLIGRIVCTIAYYLIPRPLGLRIYYAVRHSWRSGCPGQFREAWDAWNRI